MLNITYAHHGDQPLTMDLYYPPGTPADARLPVVIFGLGYRMSSQALRNAHFYTSWGRLVSAAGMTGIAYDTENPEQDLEILVEVINNYADDLRIDPDRNLVQLGQSTDGYVLLDAVEEGGYARSASWPAEAISTPTCPYSSSK